MDALHGHGATVKPLPVIAHIKDFLRGSRAASTTLVDDSAGPLKGHLP